MTALTATLDAGPAVQRTRGHLTFPRVLRSEWIKIRTVRSTVWTLALTVVLMVGTTVLVAWGMTQVGEAGAEAGTDGVAGLVTVGGYFAQLMIAVLGVLTITGEYSTGMIRSTLTAVPRRLPALFAKGLVLTAVALVTSVLGVALAVLASMPYHDQLGITLDLGDPEQLRILAGVPLYLTAIALLGFGIGALLRHSAGALATVLGLLLVIETVVSAIPTKFFEVLGLFLPGSAGSRLLLGDETIAAMNEASAGPDLSAWQGYGVLIAWVAVLITVAAVLLRRRDA